MALGSLALGQKQEIAVRRIRALASVTLGARFWLCLQN